MRTACKIAASLLSFAVAAPGLAQDATLITGARIFDGVSAELIEGQDVLVQDGIISAIGTGLEVPEGATVLDAEGRFLMPGFADMHAHLMFQMPFGIAFTADREYWAYVASVTAEQYLMQGFTTVRDVGGTRSR